MKERGSYHWRRGKENRKALSLTGPDGAVLATATQRSWWSSVVDLSLADGRTFVLSRPSVWKPVVRIADAQGREVGVFSSKWWSGEGELHWQGRTYQWRNRGWLSGKRAWTDAQGDYFIFHMRYRWFGMESDVEVIRKSQDDAILFALGWYLQMMEAYDSSSGGTVVLASS